MTTAVRTQRPHGAPAAPARGARRALLPLAILAGGAAAALLVQGVFDPFRTDVPLCAVYHLTGLHCPGCGASRAVHALLDGDLLLALRNNVLVVTALPLVAALYARWTVRRVQGRPLRMPPTLLVLAGVLVAVLFAVLRNLPAFWFLAPTSLIGA